MSDDRSLEGAGAAEPPEPTAGDVEAFVRSVQAREAVSGVRAIRVVPPPDPEVPPIGSPPAIESLPAIGSPPLVSPRRGPHLVPGAQRPMRAPTEGLIGRLEWDRLVADESERHRRYGRPSAIVLLELDGLDRATAQTGIGVVGRIVPPCAEAIVSISRASDRVTRLRDGRFGVLLRETDAEGARRYADRAIANCESWLAAMPWPLRMVAGWAAPEADRDLVDAVGRAEQRLREALTAKVGGRS